VVFGILSPNSHQGFGTGPPVLKPQCEFGELRILAENTYQMTKKDISMTDNLIPKITKDRALGPTLQAVHEPPTEVEVGLVGRTSRCEVQPGHC